MKFIRIWNLLPLVLLVADGPRLTAQLSACSDPWSVELRREVVLGGEDDPGGVGRFGFIANNSRGDIFTRSFEGNPVVHRYARDGVWLSTVGRLGEGPGEYRWPTDLMVDGGDSLHVFDSRLRRHIVYAPDLKHVRTERWPLAPGVASVARLADTLWAAFSEIDTPSLSGVPVHLVIDGQDGLPYIATSFGAVPGIHTSDMTLTRRIASATDSTLWVAHHSRYTLEERTLDGRLLRDMDGTVNGWVPWEKWPRISPDDAPPPFFVSDIRLDDDGRLWLIIAIPADGWEDAMIRRGSDWVPDNVSELWDGLIDVIDVRRGCRMARHRTRSRLLAFTTDGRLASHRETPGGFPFIDLWHASLVAPSNPKRNKR